MLPFYKVSGAGNDFIAIPETSDADAGAVTPERVRAWCSRGLSVGADGLFLLGRPSVGDPGTVRMTHFNADGSRATLCINGTRCAARLAFELGWESRERAEVTVVTGAGPLRARRVGGEEVSLELPEDLPNRERPPEHLAPTAAERTWPGLFVDAGVPHFVLPWPEDLSSAPVETVGPLLREHPDFGPPGANIDFVRFVERHRLEIRSFERGVEAETLACGTGVLAAVAAGLELGELELPVTALPRSGFELRVDSGPPGRWTLSGDARLVARGELLPGAIPRGIRPPSR
jgi:diaminopimelate epimerase